VGDPRTVTSHYWLVADLQIQGVPELADQTYRAFSLVITESNRV
jgi:hypothetical protein